MPKFTRTLRAFSLKQARFKAIVTTKSERINKLGPSKVSIKKLPGKKDRLGKNKYSVTFESKFKKMRPYQIKKIRADFK